MNLIFYIITNTCRRLTRIKELEELIKAEDVIEEDILAYMKNRADVFVILRYTLWNLSDILRYVGKPTKIYYITYPNSYLKLPLLKYEMLTMRAVPPENFEVNCKCQRKFIIATKKLF